MRQPQYSVLPRSGHERPDAESANSEPPPDHHNAAGRPLIERIAGWSTVHRKTAVLGWLLIVGLVFVGGQLIGTSNVNSYDPGQSGQAERALDRLHVTGQPAAENVLIQARAPGARFATDPSMRQAVRQVVAALDRLAKATVSDLRSPLGPGGGTLISGDGGSALVTFKVTGQNEDHAVLPALQAVAAIQAHNPGLRISEAGDASTDRVANTQITHDFRKAESTSLPITLLLLLGVFGALIAAGIPLLLAATAVVSAISLTSVVGQWLPTGETTSEVVLIIGMAVGVDYSLFYLRRVREERAAGRDTAQALRIASATSGRAIVISGLTVMVALAGLFLTGLDVFTGVAIGAIAVVGMTVAGSLTMLPALLSWLGDWAGRGKIPFLGARRISSRPSRFWGGTVQRVMRRPVAWGGVALIAMVALAAPAIGMRLANPPDGGFSGNVPIIKTADAIQRAFPEAPAPAVVVLTGHDLSGPAVRAQIARLRHDTSATGPIRPPVTASLAAGGRALILDVQLAGNGTDRASDQALLRLRDQVLPGTIGRVAGISYAVSGDTASNYDEIRTLDTRMPLVLAVVAVLAFILLLIAFRSPAISLLSVGLNLLSVAGAFGLMTLIFQDGRFQGLLGYTSYGAIVPWIPLFMFVFLFGLSMDYHVFILSRIDESRASGHGTRQAIVDGIGSSAGVVTSAAIIMVAVFSILATLSVIQLQMLGVGLAAAVLLDATVVRGVLLPAALAVLGDRAWYRPKWLPARRATVQDGGNSPHPRMNIGDV